MHHPTDRIAHTTAFVTLSWSTGWNVKYLNDSAKEERGNYVLPLHRVLFLISSKESVISTIPQTVHTVTFVMQVVEHWLEPLRASHN